MECGFAGNADVYGIGIRIGYYTQAFAAWYASFFHFREAQVLRDTNKLFLFALGVVGLIYVANAQETFAVEAFLLLQIGMVIALVSITDTTRYVSRYSRTSNERVVSRLAIMGAGLLFNVCFWWRGLDVMRETPCQMIGRAKVKTRSTQATNEATYMCFFVKANAYGWLRTLMRVWTLYLTVSSVLTVGFRDIVELLQAWRRNEVKRAFEAAAAAYQKGVKGENRISAPAESVESQIEPTVQSDDGPGDGTAGLQSSIPSSPPGNSSQADSMQPQSPIKICKPEQSSSTSGNSTDTFAAVREAEFFLESVFSIYPKIGSSSDTKHVARLFGGWVAFPIPRSAFDGKCAEFRYSKCLWSWLTMQWARQPNAGQRYVISLHMQGLGQHNFWRVPRFYHRVRQLSQTLELPEWKVLGIASDVQLSQIPLKKSARVWAGMATYTLLLIIALIVQVELTIAWNNISGLQSVSTVGQLIPFILGVGGLIKVLWGKWRLIRSGIKETLDMDIRPPSEYELAMEQYLQWKNAQKGSASPQECIEQVANSSEINGRDTGTAPEQTDVV